MAKHMRFTGHSFADRTPLLVGMWFTQMCYGDRYNWILLDHTKVDPLHLRYPECWSTPCCIGECEGEAAWVLMEAQGEVYCFCAETSRSDLTRFFDMEATWDGPVFNMGEKDPVYSGIGKINDWRRTFPGTLPIGDHDADMLYVEQVGITIQYANPGKHRDERCACTSNKEHLNVH